MELSLLSQFLRSFDTSVFNKMDDANRIIESTGSKQQKKNEMLADQVLRNMAFDCERVVPLIQEEDEGLSDQEDIRMMGDEPTPTPTVMKAKDSIEFDEFGDNVNFEDIDTNISN